MTVRRQSSGGSSSSAVPVLAGMLEKRSSWRKEWRLRFCIMRQDRIDYYLQPPAIVDTDGDCSEPAKGSISLCNAAAAEEPGKPYCIRVGDVLLSCMTKNEQQRWLRALSDAGALQGEPAPRGKPPLLLLLPRGQPLRLAWQEATTVTLSGEGEPSILLCDSEGLGARSMCRLPLTDLVAASERSVLLEPLIKGGDSSSSSGERRSLRIRVHSVVGAGPSVEHLRHPSTLALAVAVALLLGGSQLLGTLLVALTLLLLVLKPGLALPPAQRQLAFSVERLERAADPVPGLDPLPNWVGRWVLDKAHSEKYEPILADLGVSYILRKAADSVKSGLVISVSATHVTVHVKTLVSVEDCIPLDGSWTPKPVPPGSKMKGQMRVRLTKVSTRELEMHSEFPDGNGELRDTLVVHEDGNSFTRTVVRGEISVTRVFRRE